jgi:hypothetical protein
MSVLTYGDLASPFTTDTRPVSGATGTLAGTAPAGARLVDVILDHTYVNNGTKAVPTWQRIYQPNERAYRFRHFDDFAGATDTYSLECVLISSTGNLNQIGTTGTARGHITIPRSGILIGAELVTEDGLVKNDTNYITVTAVNKLASGSGAVDLLTGAAALNNTTAAAGQTLTAAKPFPLDVAMGSAVSSGDEILCLVTVTGTLGSVIDAPRVKLRIATISRPWMPRILRTAGSPYCVPDIGVSAAATGEIFIGLDATSEAQQAGMDWDNYTHLRGPKNAYFECRLRTVTTPATNSVVYFGLAAKQADTSDSSIYTEQQLSRYAYAPASLAYFAWFKLNASLALLYEGKSANPVVSSLANDAGFTLVANTPYTFAIDLRDTTAVQFLVNGNVVGTLNLGTFVGGDFLMPVFIVRKDSGTNAAKIAVDYSDASCNRS